MNPAHEWYRRLLQDARLVEVRHNTGKRWVSGLFDDLDALLDTLRHRAGTGALYTSLNRPTGRKAANAMDAEALSDRDIGTIVRLPFDFDPVRPTDTPSTDGELAWALGVRDQFVSFLTSWGWPLPAFGMSGNGAHAVYRVCIENGEAWREARDILYRNVSRALAWQGLDETVTFDTSVRNPARVWRAYGTINRKGTATEDRPHRRSEITIPSPWQPVTAAQIERVVSYLRTLESPPERPQRAQNVVPLRHGGGDYRTLDVVRWFAAHQRYLGHKEGITHRVLCPWYEEHTTAPRTGTVIFANADTWPTFHCSHAHCQDRTLRDVLNLWGDADQFCGAAWQGVRHG